METLLAISTMLNAINTIIVQSKTMVDELVNKGEVTEEDWKILDAKMKEMSSKLENI